MRPLPWSHTALADFVNCPRSYYEKRVAKSIKEDRGEEAIWGERVHKHFEDFVKDGTPLPDELADHAAFLTDLATRKGVVEAERKIALDTNMEPCEFFDRKVWFRGVIDYSNIHRGKAYLVDYKTGKPHHKFDQLKLFALHLFSEYATIMEARVEYYWTKTQTTTGETYTRDMIPSMWETFEPALRQYVEAFQTDTWQPRQSGLCNGWCPVKECEFWKPKREKR